MWQFFFISNKIEKAYQAHCNIWSSDNNELALKHAGAAWETFK